MVSPALPAVGAAPMGATRQERQARYLARAAEVFAELTHTAQQPGVSVGHLETVIREKMLHLGAVLLENVLMEDPRAQSTGVGSCPQCERPLRIQQAQQHRTLRTVVGPVAYARPYAVCDRCELSFAPMDVALGITPHGASAAFRQKVCHAAVCCRSFELAAEIMREHDGLAISHKSVRLIAEGEGGLLVAARTHEVATYRRQALTFPAGPARALLVITADGGRVQTRQAERDDRWKENKVGVVYDAVPRPQPAAAAGAYEGAQAQTKTAVATMASWDEMGWLLRVEAERRGVRHATAVVFLGDGARHVRDLKDQHFPEATFILDWAHAVEHLSACAKAAFGEGTAPAIRWYEIAKQQLWDGERDALVAELQQRAHRLGTPAKGEPEGSPRVILHRNAFSYFPTNHDAVNYPAFRAHGWPIGSGVVEGAVKQFALRLKGSEKFWNVSETGAEEMLALCALSVSEDDRWTRYWVHRAQPYRPS